VCQAWQWEEERNDHFIVRDVVDRAFPGEL